MEPHDAARSLSLSFACPVQAMHSFPFYFVLGFAIAVLATGSGDGHDSASSPPRPAWLPSDAARVSAEDHRLLENLPTNERNLLRPGSQTSSIRKQSSPDEQNGSLTDKDVSGHTSRAESHISHVGSDFNIGYENFVNTHMHVGASPSFKTASASSEQAGSQEKRDAMVNQWAADRGMLASFERLKSSQRAGSSTAHRGYFPTEKADRLARSIWETNLWSHKLHGSQWSTAPKFKDKLGFSNEVDQPPRTQGNELHYTMFVKDRQVPSYLEHPVPQAISNMKKSASSFLTSMRDRVSVRRSSLDLQPRPSSQALRPGLHAQASHSSSLLDSVGTSRGASQGSAGAHSLRTALRSSASPSHRLRTPFALDPANLHAHTMPLTHPLRAPTEQRLREHNHVHSQGPAPGQLRPVRLVSGIYNHLQPQIQGRPISSPPFRPSLRRDNPSQSPSFLRSPHIWTSATRQSIFRTTPEFRPIDHPMTLRTARMGAPHVFQRPPSPRQTPEEERALNTARSGPVNHDYEPRRRWNVPQPGNPNRGQRADGTQSEAAYHDGRGGLSEGRAERRFRHLEDQGPPGEKGAGPK